MESGQDSDTILILMPVYNDWESAKRLLPLIDEKFDVPIEIVVVDDGSTIEPPADWCQPGWERIRQVYLLSLVRNLGHQRALAVGLSYVRAHLPCRAVVVMDSDGEDDPADIPRLLRRLAEEGRPVVVFAERFKRSESRTFRFFYAVYRLLHRILTGIPVRVGNFSVIPFALLKRLVVVSDLWNHYAASVYKARLPHVSIPTRRAPRLAGQSRMDFVALVTHGLSAISVFGDRVGVRLLIVTLGLLLVVAATVVAAIVLRLTTNLAIPGWASYTVGILTAILVQLLTLLTIFVFVVLGGRESSSFLPSRDHGYFVAEMRRLVSRDG